MKHALLYLILILGCMACRRNKHDHSTYKNAYQTSQESNTVTKDSSTTVSFRNDSIIVIADERRYIETYRYGDSGELQEIQREWRGTGTRMVAGSGRGSVSNTVTGSKQESKQSTSGTGEFEQTSDSSNDSRPVQGVEWFYVVFGISVVAAIVFTIYKLRTK